jgi:hypothetical protein
MPGRQQTDSFLMINHSTQRALHGASNFRNLGGYPQAPTAAECDRVASYVPTTWPS